MISFCCSSNDLYGRRIRASHGRLGPGKEADEERATYMKSNGLDEADVPSRPGVEGRGQSVQSV